MRGWSGSGKSHAVRQCLNVYPESVVFSTDEFWMSDDGEYLFDHTRLAEAHAWNVGRVRTFLEANAESVKGAERHVIIDNTNIRRVYMQPYRDLATLHGIRMFQHMTLSNAALIKDWKKGGVEAQVLMKLYNHWRRCTHPVPLHMVIKGFEEFEIDNSMYYVTGFPCDFDNVIQNP